MIGWRRLNDKHCKYRVGRERQDLVRSFTLFPFVLNIIENDFADKSRDKNYCRLFVENVISIELAKDFVFYLKLFV